MKPWRSFLRYWPFAAFGALLLAFSPDGVNGGEAIALAATAALAALTVPQKNHTAASGWAALPPGVRATLPIALEHSGILVQRGIGRLFPFGKRRASQVTGYCCYRAAGRSVAWVRVRGGVLYCVELLPDARAQKGRWRVAHVWGGEYGPPSEALRKTYPPDVRPLAELSAKALPGG